MSGYAYYSGTRFAIYGAAANDALARGGRYDEVGAVFGRNRPAVEELIRWRLWDRTAAGLMAELGSHQLDACSIFLGKVKPLSVTGVGGKFFYGPGKNDRS